MCLHVLCNRHASSRTAIEHPRVYQAEALALALPASLGSVAASSALTPLLRGAASAAGAPGASNGRLLALREVPAFAQAVVSHGPQPGSHDAEGRPLRRILPPVTVCQT